MTPTLSGRIQTRLIMLATVGLGWLLIVGPFLPLAGPTMGVYSAGLAALLVTAIVGIAWEFVYHALQQFRWDKDWPTVFGLVLGLSEGVVVYHVLSLGIPWTVIGLMPSAFAWQFGTIWVAIWAFVNGPLRVLFPRWRFAGGQFA